MPTGAATQRGARSVKRSHSPARDARAATAFALSMLKRPSLLFVIFAASLLGHFCPVRAAVDVYPAPSDVRWHSGRYAVSVRQAAATLASPVYESTNPFHWVHQPMGESNHWTTFSFDGAIEVVVKVAQRASLQSARILPTAYGVAATVEGNTVRFKLDRPRQVALEIDGDRQNPLFIFAKERETDLPDLTAANVIDFSKNPAVHNDPAKPNVLYFPPGEYDLTALGYNLNKGFSLDAGDTVYLAGGAIVHGAFCSTGPGVTVRGRGVISGAKWMWVRKRYEDAKIPWNYERYREIAVYLHGGGKNLVEGITFTDPVHFCISVDDDSTVRGVQCFGWWYTTDGVRAGDRSVVEDSFFKVNDDIIKVYCSDMQVRRCLIWQQTNGAPFQFTWNLTAPVRGLRVSDCIIMASEVTSDRELMGNRAVVNSRLNKGAAISDFVFENIRIEGDIYRVLGLHIGESGSISNITLRNIEVTGRIKYFNYLNATGGRIDDIKLQNIRVGGQHLKTLDEFILVQRGDVGRLTID